jgi:hypothetical protein
MGRGMIKMSGEGASKKMVALINFSITYFVMMHSVGPSSRYLKFKKNQLLFLLIDVPLWSQSPRNDPKILSIHLSRNILEKWPFTICIKIPGSVATTTSQLAAIAIVAHLLATGSTQNASQ